MNMSPSFDRAQAMAATGPLPAGHPVVKSRKVGVLLSNLGTPDATDYWSMRRYLAEFLSDRRVIETPRVIWLLILHLIILTMRPGRKGKDYASIWNRELDESPLKTITRSQAEKLQAAVAGGLLGPDGRDRVVVDWAMRYGNPSMKSAVERLHGGRMRPHPAGAALSAICGGHHGDRLRQAVRDADDDALAAERAGGAALSRRPGLHRCARPLAQEAVARLDFEPEVILASFHGVPKDYLLKGDPYHCQCVKTGRLLREALGMTPDKFMLTFQSRFGPAEWLQPYTDETVKALAARGVKRMAVITPGFSADCLETIEEIGGENAEYFHHSGGEKFARIDCLNDSREGMRVIESIVRRELMGWIDGASTVALETSEAAVA